MPIVFDFQFLFESIEFKCKWKYVVVLVVATAYARPTSYNFITFFSESLLKFFWCIWIFIFSFIIQDYCQFYLGEGASEATCGQRKGMTDIPRLLVIRYLRNSSAIDTRTQDLSKWKSLLVQDLIDDTDQAGQFVAGYKGTADDSEVCCFTIKLLDREVLLFLVLSLYLLCTTLLPIFCFFLFFKQITQWLSNIIKDGDSRDLPFFVSLFNLGSFVSKPC